MTIDTIKRVACEWCGAPSGLRGVTLRIVTETKPAGYTRYPLCDPCAQEFDQFHHKVSFREWLRIYAWEWKRHVAWILSVRQHARQIRLQYRFRAKGVKVRAEAMENKQPRP